MRNVKPIIANTMLVLASSYCAPAPSARTPMSVSAIAATDTTVVSASRVLDEFGAECSRVAATHWTSQLCGPLVLVDPESRLAIANRADPARRFTRVGTVFVGTLDESDPLANTAVDWRDERWAMVMLPVPVDTFNRLRLLGHESFHRLQPLIGIQLTTPLNPHLDERDARLWLRLELRALARAVAGSESDPAAALGDALLFRANRHRLYPGSDTLEAQLEMGEGTAEYAGVRFAMDALDRSAAWVVEWSRARFERTPTFTRSLGYGTGPPLGLALDRFAPGWRAQVSSMRSLTALLADRIRWVPPADIGAVAGERSRLYEVERIVLEEDARASERTRVLTAYRARLVDGPVVVFRQRGLGGAFDPNTIVAFGEAGTIYPRRTFVAEWGTLRVTDGGALVSTDKGQLRVAALPEPVIRPARVVVGGGWELELADGWILERSVRAGDWEVKRAAPIRTPP